MWPDIHSLITQISYLQAGHCLAGHKTLYKWIALKTELWIINSTSFILFKQQEMLTSEYGICQTRKELHGQVQTSLIVDFKITWLARPSANLMIVNCIKRDNVSISSLRNSSERRWWRARWDLARFQNIRLEPSWQPGSSDITIGDKWTMLRKYVLLSTG